MGYRHEDVIGYSYKFDGVGLTIYTPMGDVYLQGEEASALYDELESLETDEQVARVLGEYEHVCS